MLPLAAFAAVTATHHVTAALLLAAFAVWTLVELLVARSARRGGDTARRSEAERARWDEHNAIERGNATQVFRGPEFARVQG